MVYPFWQIIDKQIVIEYHEPPKLTWWRRLFTNYHKTFQLVNDKNVERWRECCFHAQKCGVPIPQPPLRYALS